MTYNHIIRLLDKDPQTTIKRYAIVDCAATSDDLAILSKIQCSGAPKVTLLTGESAWTADHMAPYLLQLNDDPDLEKWLLETGWGLGWGIYFSSQADIRALAVHFRSLFLLRADNGRETFFRFYDPAVMGDILPLLSQKERAAFFGPADRFVFEGPEGEPLAYDKPRDLPTQPGDPSQPIDFSKMILGPEKKKQLSEPWRRRLFAQHIAAYQALGLHVTPDAAEETLTLEDKSGAAVRLQKTPEGVAAVTGEKRRFQYALTSCKHPAKVIDPAGNAIHFDIQERNNLEKENPPPMLSAIRMEGGEKTWVFDYDEMHHLSRIDYPDGAGAQIEHDSYGNPIRWVDRNGNATCCTYDLNERLTRFENANGHSTRFDYEALTAPAAITFADGLAFNFEYTDAGALKKFLAGNTCVADYRVDPESGSWKVHYTDGGQAEFVVKSGRIVKAVNAAGTVELDYDADGRLIRETFQNRSVTYHRNASGQLTGITTPLGQTIQYALDGENRVCRINAWSGRKIDIQYSPNGAMQSISYPNGTRLEQNTDAMGLPDRMFLDGRRGILFDKTLQRDGLNRVTRVSDREHKVTYHYDKEGRLLKTRSSRKAYDETFTIDANANRLADDLRRYQVNAADRLIRADRTDFQYDPLGNLIRGTCPRGDAAFAFTGLNRLKSVSLARGRAQYLYDAFGRRVAKKVNGVTTRYYWARSQIVHEARFHTSGEKTSAQITDYLFFPQTPVLLGIRRNRRIHWAAFGHRYETLCLTDEGGKLVWQARYDVFGRAHVQVGGDLHQPFRLPGQYYDPESGLHYNVARYYDPSLGRFLSPDPLFLEGGSTNFYAYCNGDPINFIDPGGEFIFCTILIGAAIGAAIGAGIEALRQRRAGEETDGFKIAKAALIGGVIGGIGGGVGAAVEAAAAAGTLGTAMASSTLPAMAGVGFLSGAGSSLAEQCAEAQMSGKAVDPLSMAGQALTDGVIGGGVSLVTFGAGGFLARRLRRAPAMFRPLQQLDEGMDVARQSRIFKSQKPHPPQVQKKGRQSSVHSDKSMVGEPVNAVTGEVILTQTDFTLPGRIPLTWTRHYGSQNQYEGVLGRGWQTPADARLEVDGKGLVTFYDGSPGGAVFSALPDETPVMEASDGAVLSAVEDQYQVRLKSGLTYHFPKSDPKTIEEGPATVTAISDPHGNALSFIRDDRGALTRICDSAGQCIQITCDRGRIRTMHLGDRRLVGYQYDHRQLIAAVDAMGRPKRFEYQDRLLTRHSDTNRLSFYYEYDSSGRCVHTWGDGGLYDCRLDHRPYERCVVVTDSLGRHTTYTYDNDRLPIVVRDSAGAATTYEYDEVGRVICVSDPLERATRYTYDDAGNVVEIHRPDQNRIQIAYDANHRPVQMCDANGKLWEQRFDQQGRLIEKIDPLKAGTRYQYNNQGDLTAVTDPEGRTSAFEYDDSGLLAAVIDPHQQTTRYQRDLLGNITAVIDAQGRTTRYRYDDAARLIQSVPPSGHAQQFEWDGEGNLLLHTDPAGQQTRFAYGGVNEIVRRINADGTSVSYAYDTEENLTGVTNEKGRTHRFTYDHANRVIAQTDYWGHTTRYHYDPAGQLIRSVDPLGRPVLYDYDDAGRLQTKTFENDEQEFFHWDANGNLIGVQSPGAMVERFYDAANRLIAEKSGEFVVQYQYDHTGRRTQRTTSHGHTVKYRYDAAGAVEAIRINDHDPVLIQRDRLGRITGEQLSPHLNRSLGYNPDGLLTRQSIHSAAGDMERRYEYDPAGRLIAKTDSRKGPWQFTYDPMGRITEALDPERQRHCFGYDPTGDLLDHLPHTGKGLRSARHNNILYHYDAAGNLAERQNGHDLTRFHWDEQNRLKTARKIDDTRITMTYDALGRRHIKAVNGERTFFKWEGDALLSEQFEEEAPREYVYYPGTFEPLAVIDGDGQVYYYHNDLNGLPQELTKPSGDIVWSATYDALGRVDQILVDEVAQPFRFQGQYWDDEIGLCYNRYRYYDPQICSFISQDPLGLAVGENIYAYAPNVWGWVDPHGLCKDTQDRGFFSTIKDIFKGKKSSGDPNILSGHGAFNPKNGMFTVPEGTSVTVFTEHGKPITDKLGQYIETGRQITLDDFGPQLYGAKTYLPGSQMPNYTLYPSWFPPKLKIMGNPTTVYRPMKLSKLITENQGNVKWAACLSEL
jgi:RHS repeat-associated protein